MDQTITAIILTGFETEFEIPSQPFDDEFAASSAFLEVDLIALNGHHLGVNHRNPIYSPEETNND